MSGYLNLVNGFVYKDPVFRAKLDALAENDAYLKDNGWNTSTEILFYQAAVPTGWTKDATKNNKYLRVTTGAGAGTGGSLAAGSAVGLAHSSHVVSLEPDHTHSLTHTHVLASAADSKASANGGAISVHDVSGNMYTGNNASGSASAKQVKSTLLTPTFLSSGAGGAHNHGGASVDTSLADITFAYCDVIAGAKDSSTGYTDLTNYFHTGDKIDFDPFVTLAQNDEYNRLRLMPSGSVVVWGQASAPTGWTKLATVDDKALRVVSGTGGGTGGSYSPSTLVNMQHTHTAPTGSTHSHTIAAHSHQLQEDANPTTYTDPGAASAYVQADASGFLRASSISGPSSTVTAYKTATNTDGADTTAAEAIHHHTLQLSGNNFTLACLDAIQCSKDSAGAPSAYLDLTSGVFGWKKLVSYQKLNKLPANDDYLLYHSPEAGSKLFFLMATPPITWTKITTVDDKALRMVSGSSGGSASGGAQGLSVALPLAHTHAIDTVLHNHAIGSHTHTLASGSQTANPYTNSFGGAGIYDVGHLAQAGTSSGTAFKKTSDVTSANTDTLSHNHGGSSGSALSDVTLAYADVIYCSKN